MSAARRSLIAWLALAASTQCAPVLAQDGGRTDPEAQQTSYVMQLFRETCGTFFSDPTLVAQVAKKYAYPPNPPYSAELLNGMQGQVWDASAGGKSALALMLLDAGGKACQIHARNIDPDLLQKRFRSLMEGIRTPGMVAQLYEQRKADKGGVTLEQTGYFLSKAGLMEGWSFVLTTSTTTAAGWHATFTVAPAVKER